MNRLRVFMYHKVSQDKTDFLTVKTDDFRKQMTFLKSRFNILSLKQVLEALNEGRRLPARSAMLSFDDGYMNNYSQAYPVLKSLQLPFTVFLVGNYIGKTIEHDNELQSFMGPSELKEMSDLANYAYHGLSHENLMDMDESVWETYISKTKESFANLDIDMQDSWAYTYGAYPGKSKDRMKKMREAFENQGIKCAFRIGNRINSWPLKNPYKIQRIDIRGDQPYWKFKLKAWLGKISI